MGEGRGFLLILIVLVIFTSMVLVQAANVTTPPTETQCFDSDIDQTGLRESGRNYFVKGNTSNVLLSTTGGQPYVLGTRTDSCEGIILKENYCSSPSKIETESVDCKQVNPNFRCVEGACVYIPDFGPLVPEPTSTAGPPHGIPCLDSDGGLNLFTKGTTGIQGQTQYEDFCLGERTIQEYFCKQGDISIPTPLTMNCPDNTECDEGACKQLIVPPYTPGEKRTCSKDCPEDEDLAKKYIGSACLLDDPEKPEVLDGPFINLTPTILPKPQPSVGKAECSDKADNDEDNFTDYPDDVGCKSKFDISETPDIDITVFSESATQYLLNLYRTGKLTGPQAINFVDNLAVPTGDKPEIKNLLTRFIEKEERLKDIENRLNQVQTAIDSDPQAAAEILNGIKLDMPSPALPGLQPMPTTGSSATTSRGPAYSNSITGFDIAIKPSELETVKKLDVVEPNTIIGNIIQNQQLLGKQSDTFSSCLDPTYEMSQTVENIRKHPCLAQKYSQYIKDVFSIAETSFQLLSEITTLPSNLFSDIQDFIEKFNDPEGENQLREAKEKITKTDELLRNKKTDLELRKRILKQHPEYRETEADVTDSRPIEELYKERQNLEEEQKRIARKQNILNAAGKQNTAEYNDNVKKGKEIKTLTSELTIQINRKTKLAEIEQEFQKRGLQGQSVDEVEKDLKELEELADPETRRQKTQDLKKTAQDRANYLKDLDQIRIEEKISEKILAVKKLPGKLNDIKTKFLSKTTILKPIVAPSGCAQSIDSLKKLRDVLDKTSKYIEALEESNRRATDTFSSLRSKDINETIINSLRIYQHLTVSSNHAENTLKKLSEAAENFHNVIGFQAKCDLPCPLGPLPEYLNETGTCVSCQKFYEKKGPYWGPKKWRTPEEVLTDGEIAVQRALQKLEEANTPEELDAAREEYIKLREAELEGDPEKKEIMDLEKQKIDEYVQKRKDISNFNNQLAEVIDLVNKGKNQEAKTAFGKLQQDFNKIKSTVKGGVEVEGELGSISAVIAENLQRGELLSAIQKLENATTKEEAEAAATAITSVVGNATFLDNQTKSKLLNQTKELKEAKLTVIKYKADMDKMEELLKQNQIADAHSFYTTTLNEAKRNNDTLGIQYIQARLNRATGGKGINRTDIIIQLTSEGRDQDLEKFIGNLTRDEQIEILAVAADKSQDIQNKDKILSRLQTTLETLEVNQTAAKKYKEKFMLAILKYQKGVMASQTGEPKGLDEWRRLWNESSILLDDIIKNGLVTSEQRDLATKIKKSIDYSLRLDNLGSNFAEVKTTADLGELISVVEKDLATAKKDLDVGTIDINTYSDFQIKYIQIKFQFWQKKSLEEGTQPHAIADLFKTISDLESTLTNPQLAPEKRQSLSNLVALIYGFIKDNIGTVTAEQEAKTASLSTAAVEEEEHEQKVRESLKIEAGVETQTAVDLEIQRIEARLERIRAGHVRGSDVVGSVWNEKQARDYIEFLRRGVSRTARLALQQHRETLKSLLSIKIELEKSQVDIDVQSIAIQIQLLKSSLGAKEKEFDSLFARQQSTPRGPEWDRLQKLIESKQQELIVLENKIKQLQFLHQEQESYLAADKKEEIVEKEITRLSGIQTDLQTQIQKKETELKEERKKYFWSRDDKKIERLESEIKTHYEQLRTTELQRIVLATPKNSKKYSRTDVVDIESTSKRYLTDEWASEIYAGTRWLGEDTDISRVRELEHRLWVLDQETEAIAVYRGLQAGRQLPEVLTEYYDKKVQALLTEIDKREETKNQQGVTNPKFEILTGIINQDLYQSIALSHLNAELQGIRNAQTQLLSILPGENTADHAEVVASLVDSQVRLSQAEWKDRFSLTEETGIFRPFAIGFQAGAGGAADITRSIFTSSFEQRILNQIDFSKPIEEIVAQINNLPEEDRKILVDGRRNTISFLDDRKIAFDQTAESRLRYAQLLTSISRGGQALDTIKQTDRTGYIQLVLTGWVSASGQLQTPQKLPEWIPKSLFDEDSLPAQDYLSTGAVTRFASTVVLGGLAARAGATVLGGLATGLTGSTTIGQTTFWLTFPGLFVPAANTMSGIFYGEKGDYSLKHFASSYLTVWGLGGLGYLGRGVTRFTGLTSATGELVSASLLRSLASGGIHFSFEVFGFWATGNILYTFTGQQEDRITLEQAMLTTVGLKIAGLPTHNTFTRFFDALGVKSAEFGDFFGRWYEQYSTTLKSIRDGSLQREEALRQLNEQGRILRNALKRFGIEDKITVDEPTPEAVVNKIIQIIISRRVQKGESGQQIVETILNSRLKSGMSKEVVENLRAQLLLILQSDLPLEQKRTQIFALGFNPAETESILGAGEGLAILEGLQAQMADIIKRNFRLVVDFTNPNEPTGRREVNKEKMRAELGNLGLSTEEIESVIVLLEGGLFIVNPPPSAALTVIKREQEEEDQFLPTPQKLLPAAVAGEMSRSSGDFEVADFSGAAQPVAKQNGDGVLSFDIVLPDGRRITRVILIDAKNHGESAQKIRDEVIRAAIKHRNTQTQEEFLQALDAELQASQLQGTLADKDFTAYTVIDIDPTGVETKTTKSGNRLLFIDFDAETKKAEAREPSSDSVVLPVPKPARGRISPRTHSFATPTLIITYSDGFEDYRFPDGSKVGNDRVRALVLKVAEDVLKADPQASSDQLTDAFLIEWSKFVADNMLTQTDDISIAIVRPRPQLPTGYTTNQYRDLVASANRLGQEVGLTDRETQTAVAILTDGGFSAPLRHDIRTPATIINGFLENMRDVEDLGEQASYLDSILSPITGGLESYSGSILEKLYIQYLIYLDLVAGRDPSRRNSIVAEPLPTDKEGALKNFMVLFRKIREEAAKINIPEELEAYKDRQTDETAKKRVDTVVENTKRLVFMIEELTGGSTRPIDQWLTVFGGKVKLTRPPEVSRYVTNARMVQLLINLVSNSERAADERQIRELDTALTIEIQGGVAVLTYIDNAGGIDLQGILDSAKNSPNRATIEKDLCKPGVCTSLDALDSDNPQHQLIIARLIFAEGVTTKEHEPGMHGIGMAGVKSMLEKAARDQGLDPSNVIEVIPIEGGTKFTITIPVIPAEETRDRDSKKHIIDQIVQIHQTLGLKLPVDIRTRLFALSFDDLKDELNRIREEAAEKLDVNKFINRIPKFAMGAAPGTAAEFAVEVTIRDHIREAILQSDLAEISLAREKLDSVAAELPAEIVEKTRQVINDARDYIISRKPLPKPSGLDPEGFVSRAEGTLERMIVNNIQFISRPETLRMDQSDYWITGLLGEGESKVVFKVRLADGRLGALHVPKSMEGEDDLETFNQEVDAARSLYSGVEIAGERLGAEFVGEADYGYITLAVDEKHLDEMSPEEITSLYERGLIPTVIENARRKVQTLADLGYGDFDLQFLVSPEGEVTLIDPENVGTENPESWASPDEVENKIRRIVETKLAQARKVSVTKPVCTQCLSLSTYRRLVRNVDALKAKLADLRTQLADPDAAEYTTFEQTLDRMEFVSEDLREEINRVNALSTHPTTSEALTADSRRALIIETMRKYYFDVVENDFSDYLRLLETESEVSPETAKDVYDRYNAISKLATGPKELVQATRAAKNALERFGYPVDNVIIIRDGEYIISPIVLNTIRQAGLEKGGATFGMSIAGFYDAATRDKISQALESIGFSPEAVSGILSVIQSRNILISSYTPLTTYYHERYHSVLQPAAGELLAGLYTHIPERIRYRMQRVYLSGYTSDMIPHEFWADYFAYRAIDDPKFITSKLGLTSQELAEIEQAIIPEEDREKVEQAVEIIKGGVEPEDIKAALATAVRGTSGRIGLRELIAEPEPISLGFAALATEAEKKEILTGSVNSQLAGSLDGDLTIIEVVDLFTEVLRANGISEADRTKIEPALTRKEISGLQQSLGIADPVLWNTILDQFNQKLAAEPVHSVIEDLPEGGVCPPCADIRNSLEAAESSLDLTKIGEARTKLKIHAEEILNPETTVPEVEDVINRMESQITSGRQQAEKAADIIAHTLNSEPIERPNVLSQQFNREGQTIITVNSMDGVKEMLEQYAPGTAVVVISKYFISSLPPEYTKSRLGDPEGAAAQFRVGLLHAREYSDRFEIHRDAVDPRRQPIMHLWHDSPETLAGIVTAIGAGYLSASTVWSITESDYLAATTALQAATAIGKAWGTGVVSAIVTGFATHYGGRPIRIAIMTYFERKLREKVQGREEAKREINALKKQYPDILNLEPFPGVHEAFYGITDRAIARIDAGYNPRSVLKELKEYIEETLRYEDATRGNFCGTFCDPPPFPPFLEEILNKPKPEEATNREQQIKLSISAIERAAAKRFDPDYSYKQLQGRVEGKLYRGFRDISVTKAKDIVINGLRSRTNIDEAKTTLVKLLIGIGVSEAELQGKSYTQLLEMAQEKFEFFNAFTVTSRIVAGAYKNKMRDFLTSSGKSRQEATDLIDGRSLEIDKDIDSVVKSMQSTSPMSSTAKVFGEIVYTGSLLLEIDETKIGEENLIPISEVSNLRYESEVVVLGDIPIEAITGLWYNGQKVFPLEGDIVEAIPVPR